MIRGYADAGRILKKPEYTDTAIRAAEFVVENLATDDHRLFRTHTDGQAKLNAYLINYACLIDGLLSLHQATGERKWLELADQFQQKQDELFWDGKSGGYFYTSNDHEVLLVRSKKSVDNVIPAGNSLAASNLLYLANQLQKPDYRKRSQQAVISASAMIEQIPVAAPRLLVTAGEFLEQ